MAGIHDFKTFSENNCKSLKKIEFFEVIDSDLKVCIQNTFLRANKKDLLSWAQPEGGEVSEIFYPSHTRRMSKFKEIYNV